MYASFAKSERRKSHRFIFLDKPKTDKVQECGEGNGFRYGVAAMQGWRGEMEDAHMVKINLGNTLENWSYFAVFDGHGGPRVARYAAKYLLDTIIATKEFQEDVTKAICDGFLELDSKIQSLSEVTLRRDRSGSTAVCAFVSPKNIYIANCGDSRAVMCSHDQIFCTNDHKPRDITEFNRICQAGGYVIDNRVNGKLSVSRALGDFRYKNVQDRGPCEQMVSAEPEIFVRERDQVGDEFLVLACDGIWDVMNNKELCAFIRNRLTATSDLREVTAQIVDACLDRNSRDNMTVVLVVFPGAFKPTNEVIPTEKRLNDAIETRISDGTLCNTNSIEEDKTGERRKSSAREGPSDENTADEAEAELEMLFSGKSKSRGMEIQLDSMDLVKDDQKYEQTHNKHRRPKSSAGKRTSDIVNKRRKSSARKVASKNMGPIEGDSIAEQTEMQNLGRTRSESRTRKRILDSIHPHEECKENGQRDVANEGPKSPASERLSVDLDSIEEDQIDLELNGLVKKKSRLRVRSLINKDPIGENRIANHAAREFVDRRSRSRSRKWASDNVDSIQDSEADKQVEVEPDQLVRKRPKSRVRKKLFDSMEAIEDDKKDPPVIIGVIGTGKIGSLIVGKLIRSGYTVHIWNRTHQRSVALSKVLNHNKRLMVHDTVQSLLIHSDNIFICISDETELRLFFRDNFSYKTEEKVLQGKGIVIMTSMSKGTAKDMNDLIEKKGGRYLEALIQWSSVDNDRFILLAAGDEMLFRSIQPCTKAFSISIEFLGDAGSACCVYLILQLIKGVCLAGLSEGMQLAERFGLSSSYLQTLFEDSPLSSNYLKDKMAKIIDRQVESPDQRLEDLETDLKLVLDLSNELDETDQVRHNLETCAISHQLLKHCCKLDYGSFDPAAIHLRNKH